MSCRQPARQKAKRMKTCFLIRNGARSVTAGALSTLCRRSALAGLLAAAALGAGCTVVTYRNPDGEQFSRLAVGSRTSLSGLAIETGTNGVRRVELRGYQHESTQALGTLTEAAVRAALQPR